MTRDSWHAIYGTTPKENKMTAVQTLIEQRDGLRREADALDRRSDKAAVDGDRLYEQSASLAAQAHEVREEIKKYNVAIGALGGEPKQARKPAVAARKVVDKVKGKSA